MQQNKKCQNLYEIPKIEQEVHKVFKRLQVLLTKGQLSHPGAPINCINWRLMVV
jgi:hypothetical protein